ncbi:superantigen-like protein SSL4 [Kozakia baliensis]|uniref:hypothetical protein n=1 Tax=Kozakia baliensis TaxID=153496 RepID=UPI00068C8C6F|nr:hypothetical protein [Kozakia baliensis]AOX21455.1 hypothetical protein A0U90_13175 [Kozakia baliensis]
MSKGQQRLEARLKKPIESAGVGEVYLWLLAHRETIGEARALGIKWSEIIQAAQEDGIAIEDCRGARVSIQKSWKRVHRAWTTESQRRAEIESAKAAAQVQPATSRIMPSRLPASWRPEFVDPGSAPSPQPVAVNTPERNVVAPQKNALATTNTFPVASSNAELTSVPTEGKTRSQIIFEGYQKRFTEEANRKAGYIKRENE